MRVCHSVLVVSLAVAGCSSPEPPKLTSAGGSRQSSGSSGSSGGDPSVLDPEDAGTVDELPPPPPPPVDTDGDGIPDKDDCDPASAALAGTKLLDDALAADLGVFTAATGFPSGSWAYTGGAYRQTRIADATDATLFTTDLAIGDVQVDVRSASTEIADIQPRLRQIFILVGATMSGGQLDA